MCYKYAGSFARGVYNTRRVLVCSYNIKRVLLCNNIISEISIKASDIYYKTCVIDSLYKPQHNGLVVNSFNKRTFYQSSI